MALVERLLSAAPVAAGQALGGGVLVDGASALQDCAQAATVCADACLGEEAVEELIGCVRALLDLADVCATTSRVLLRSGADPALVRAMLEACAIAAAAARERCQEHLAIHYYCSICAQACRRAEVACRELQEFIS